MDGHAIRGLEEQLAYRIAEVVDQDTAYRSLHIGFPSVYF